MKSEDAFVKRLQQLEQDAASYYESELAKAQEEALNRFYGRPYGDEVPNRSAVVSRDLEDTINWIMPDLIRTFVSDDDVVSVKAQNPDDDAAYPGAPQGKSKADVIAAYLSHIYFRDNAGLQNTHDFIFDGLLSRIGVMDVAWKDPEPSPPMLIEGVGEMTVQKYLFDPEYEIIEADFEQREDGTYYVLEVRRTPRMGRVIVTVVPPEEFAIEKTAKSVDDAKYHRRKRPVYQSELIRLYPDKADDLKNKRWKSQDIYSDPRSVARQPDESISFDDDDDDEVSRQLWMCEEYVRHDFDGDGIVELRHVKRVDDIILENVAVHSSQFVTWTPSRVSHKVVGRSLADVLADLSKIRTVITRRYLDGLSQTVTPRTYVNTAVIEKDGIDALLDNDIGGVIPVKGDPRLAVYEAVTPDVSAPCLNALAYFDEQGAQATGVTKQSQGMDPEAMNKTATGIDLLQAAAKTRVEMVARWAALGLECVFKRILHLVAAHQDAPRMVKLFGHWCEIDPRTWSDEMAVKIDPGGAGVSRHQRLANLTMIAAKQEQIWAAAGANQPLVSLQHLRNTYSAMVSHMGFADPSKFFGEVPPDYRPEPQPDPKMQEAQAKLQLEQAKAQQDAQLAAQKQQIETQLSSQKIASERELAMIKARSEREIAEIRLQAETQLARERMAMEMQLAREKADLEAQLAERDSVRRAEVGLASASAKANGMASGNRPGGSLAQ